jgi:hypothetical protein
MGVIMMGRRAPGRWQTPFGQWVSDYGVNRIRAELGITPNAVYAWVSGRAAPRIEIAERLTRMSEGKLTLEHIYHHQPRMERLGADQRHDR